MINIIPSVWLYSVPFLRLPGARRSLPGIFFEGIWSFYDIPSISQISTISLDRATVSAFRYAWKIRPSFFHSYEVILRQNESPCISTLCWLMLVPHKKHAGLLVSGEMPLIRCDINSRKKSAIKESSEVKIYYLMG